MPRKGRRKQKQKKEAEETAAIDSKDHVTDSSQSETTKNAKKKTKTTVELTKKELERRQKQKELQRIIVRLMKKGATKDEIRRAKIQYRHGGAKCATGKQRKRARDRSGMGGQSAAEWREAQYGHNRKKDEKPQKGFDHDMVIVPVFWKRETEQRQQILEAAENIKKDIIAQVRFNIWIDQRTKYTPGQKFAFWEHRGVKYRIELGPKEVDNEECTVCLCETPGAVAQRFKVKLDASEIIKKLRELKAPLGTHSARSSNDAGGFSLIRKRKQRKTFK